MFGVMRLVVESPLLVESACITRVIYLKYPDSGAEQEVSTAINSFSEMVTYL